ncbi:class I tRNA ligase family protein, partial [Candidatus Woesearchaeota archaeon]|nr:class I tRNA ligase family protein [Candidatus Woesearchaeota archaeon]
VCRCLTQCHVKLVDNQWFLAYGSQTWKQKTMKSLSELKLYPEKIRPQFEHVIDWLKDWACTRELGLGTKLPWDEKWVIESLSDSTLYPAYYTIAHLIDEIPVTKINDKLFDYIFLGKGDIKEIKIEKTLLDQMRAEFLYWYPVDFRNSGKDLVQNHLAFYLFNHTAIFNEEHWPKGIGVNGYVTIGKAKMSKSKGNVKNLRGLVKTFTPDITRITILSGGEELADVDWDEDFAVTIKNKLEQWYIFACENYNKEGTTEKAIDKWMESQLNTVIKKTTTAMNETMYRTAIMTGFFDLQRQLKWYLRRRAGTINTALINKIIETQTKLLTPFVPHLCEEIWMKLQKQGLITQEMWPVHEETKINPALEVQETMIANTLEDINAVTQLAKIQKAKEATIIVAEDWKYTLFKKIKEQMKNTRNQGEIIRTVMQTELKKYGEKISGIVQKILKDPSKMPQYISHQEAELQFLIDSKEFFEQELNCTVKIVAEQESKEQKAGQAMPAKPAIVVQ